LSSPEVFFVVCYNGFGIAGYREFDKMIVAFIWKIRPPAVINGDPLAARSKSLQDIFAFLGCGARTPYVLASEQIFVLKPERIAE
jgi:hypothetical protein